MKKTLIIVGIVCGVVLLLAVFWTNLEYWWYDGKVPRQDTAYQSASPAEKAGIAVEEIDKYIRDKIDKPPTGFYKKAKSGEVVERLIKLKAGVPESIDLGDWAQFEVKGINGNIKFELNKGFKIAGQPEKLERTIKHEVRYDPVLKGPKVIWLMLKDSGSEVELEKGKEFAAIPKGGNPKDGVLLYSIVATSELDDEVTVYAIQN